MILNEGYLKCVVDKYTEELNSVSGIKYKLMSYSQTPSFGIHCEYQIFNRRDVLVSIVGYHVSKGEVKKICREINLEKLVI